MSWYILRAATRRETVADEALREAGFITYLPTVTAWNRLGRDKEHTEVKRPFLPGYLFVQIPDGAFKAAEQADGVHGVVRYTSNSGERCPRDVSERVICTVKAILATGEFDQHPPSQTKIGSIVRITTGPLASLIGQVRSVKRNGRLMVLLDAIQKGAPVKPVEIAEDKLEEVLEEVA